MVRSCEREEVIMQKVTFVKTRPRAERYIPIGKFTSKVSAKEKAKDWVNRSSEKGMCAKIYLNSSGLFVVYLKKTKGPVLPVPRRK